jgi:hypothetical protein
MLKHARYKKKPDPKCSSAWRSRIRARAWDTVIGFVFCSVETKTGVEEKKWKKKSFVHKSSKTACWIATTVVYGNTSVREHVWFYNWVENQNWHVIGAYQKWQCVFIRTVTRRLIYINYCYQRITSDQHECVTSLRRSILSIGHGPPRTCTEGAFRGCRRGGGFAPPNCVSWRA